MRDSGHVHFKLNLIFHTREGVKAGGKILPIETKQSKKRGLNQLTYEVYIKIKDLHRS